MKIGRIGSAEESVMVCQEFVGVFFERSWCAMCDCNHCEDGCVRRTVETQQSDVKQEFTGQWCQMSEERKKQCSRDEGNE